jgi:histidinol phosphatase-like enzyme
LFFLLFCLSPFNFCRKPHTALSTRRLSDYPRCNISVSRHNTSKRRLMCKGLTQASTLLYKGKLLRLIGFANVFEKNALCLEGRRTGCRKPAGAIVQPATEFHAFSPRKRGRG